MDLFQFGKGVAFEVLHDEEARAVLLANVVQGANMRMIQAGNCLGLLIEALAQSGIVRQVRGQDFERRRCGRGISPATTQRLCEE